LCDIGYAGSGAVVTISGGGQVIPVSVAGVSEADGKMWRVGTFTIDALGVPAVTPIQRTDGQACAPKVPKALVTATASSAVQTVTQQEESPPRPEEPAVPELDPPLKEEEVVQAGSPEDEQDPPEAS